MKELSIGSKINGLFKFDEEDSILGIYGGTQKVKHGEVLVLKSADGEKAVGVPVYSALTNLTDRVSDIEDENQNIGIFIKFKGKVKSKNKREYMDFTAKAYILESEDDIKTFNKKNNVEKILSMLPDWNPQNEGSDPIDDDDDLPF